MDVFCACGVGGLGLRGCHGGRGVNGLLTAGGGIHIPRGGGGGVRLTGRGRGVNGMGGKTGGGSGGRCFGGGIVFAAGGFCCFAFAAKSMKCWVRGVTVAAGCFFGCSVLLTAGAAVPRVFTLIFTPCSVHTMFLDRERDLGTDTLVQAGCHFDSFL